MAILCKPDNFELHNSLRLRFMYIQGLPSNFVTVNLSFNRTLLTFFLCVRQAWVTQLILAISLWQVIFLWSKRILQLVCIVSHFVKEGLSFAWDLSLENSGFYWLYFTQCLTSFSSFSHLLRLCTGFLILFHLTDEVLSIKTSADVFVFGYFHIH